MGRVPSGAVARVPEGLGVRLYRLASDQVSVGEQQNEPSPSLSTRLYMLGPEPLDLGNYLRIPNLTLSVKSNFTDEEIEHQSLDFLPKVRNESQIRIQAVWFQSLCFYLLFYGCVYMYVCMCKCMCVSSSHSLWGGFLSFSSDSRKKEGPGRATNSPFLQLVH